MQINATLRQFVESWNNHLISTENNLTANQRFVKGILRQQHQPHDKTPNIGITQPLQCGDIVEVPKTRFQACNALQTTLHAVIQEMKLKPVFKSMLKFLV